MTGSSEFPSPIIPDTKLGNILNRVINRAADVVERYSRPIPKEAFKPGLIGGFDQALMNVTVRTSILMAYQVTVLAAIATGGRRRLPSPQG